MKRSRTAFYRLRRTLRMFRNSHIPPIGASLSRRHYEPIQAACQLLATGLTVIMVMYLTWHLCDLEKNLIHDYMCQCCLF
jgi:hypothetical protein